MRSISLLLLFFHPETSFPSVPQVVLGNVQAQGLLSRFTSEKSNFPCKLKCFRVTRVASENGSQKYVKAAHKPESSDKAWEWIRRGSSPRPWGGHRWSAASWPTLWVRLATEEEGSVSLIVLPINPC